MPERIVPIAEVQTDRITIEGRLPYQLDQQLGIREKHLTRLLQLGGISHITVVFDHNGDTTKTLTQAVSVNSDGSATAGATRVKSVDLSTSSSKSDEAKSKQSAWIDTEATINVAEMQQRILHNDERVTNPKAWKAGLDTAISSAVTRESIKHLLELPQLFEYGVDGLGAYAVHTMITVMAVSHKQGDEIPIFALKQMMFAGILATVLQSFSDGIERPGKGRRFSLFFGVEIDRAILLYITSKMQSTVDVVR